MIAPQYAGANRTLGNTKYPDCVYALSSLVRTGEFMAREMCMLRGDEVRECENAEEYKRGLPVGGTRLFVLYDVFACVGV